MRLAGRVAIVTGGTQGIGLGVAQRLGKEGAKVVICSRSPHRGVDAIAAMSRLGIEARYTPVDMSDRDQAHGLVDFTIREFGRVDIIVNNAQIMPPWIETDSEEMDRHLENVLRSGLFGSLWTSRAALPDMRKRGWGRIINFGSLNSVQGTKYSAHYNSGKAAIQGLTRTLASEWGQYGITANVIMPSGMSPAVEAYFEANPEFAKMKHFPLRRMGDPERDIGGAIMGLVSDSGGYITGQTIFADGGIFLRKVRQNHSLFAPQH